MFPTEPQGDPLREWLVSCNLLRDTLPDDVLVLPAHETPFYGLHARMGQLIREHNDDLRTLFHDLVKPRRAVDCFASLFRREIDDSSIGLATGETLAHLNCLLGHRRITRTRDEHGVDWYQNIPEQAEYDRNAA